MSRQKAMTALAYFRVSGVGQVKGDGFPRQRAAIAAYAKAHGMKVVAEYRDEGVSGVRELDDRPGLAALLDRLDSNGVDTVLVERADRLARDLLVSEVILGQFRDKGVKVVAADGGGELTAGDDDPTRVLIRQVLGAVSQFEKSVLILKLKAARDRKRAEQGWCEGRKPFGHRSGERATIERIKQLRRKPRGGRRLSFAKVAEVLNDAGRPTRCGRPWAATSVRNIWLRK